MNQEFKRVLSKSGIEVSAMAWVIGQLVDSNPP